MGLALCVALSGCEQLGGVTSDNSQGAIAACEQATQRTLLSPTSYKRVWANFAAREPLSEEDQQLYDERDKCTARKEARAECTRTDLERFADAYAAKKKRDVERKTRRGQPLTADEQNFADIIRTVAARDATNPNAAKTGFVTLEFDSANNFGVQVRSFGICRFGPIGDDGKFEAGDIFQIGPVSRADGEAAKDAAAKSDKRS